MKTSTSRLQPHAYGTDIIDIYRRAATYIRLLIIDFRSDRLSGKRRH
jgi:hypothetical protein